MQSKLQLFLGTKSTPKEKPSLLEGTGPKVNLSMEK
jgi:hypothetical protein